MDIQDIINTSKKADERKEQLKAIYSDSQERNTANLAANQGLEYVDLKKVNIDISALQLISETDAKQYGLVGFQIKEKNLAIATLSQTEQVLQIGANLEKQGYKIQWFICSLASLEHVFVKYALVSKPREVITDVLDIIDYKLVDFVDLAKIIKDLDKNNISLINATIFKSAIAAGASDVHISPKENEVIIKFRIDGMLFDVVTIPTELY
jgi:type IV pilus assembly protein PilB